jgi:hypothetical protein
MSSDGQSRDFVFWFLELIALGCVLVAVEERFAIGQIRSGVRWLIAGLIIGVIGFTWRQLWTLFASIPRVRIVTVPKQPAVDLIEEGRQRQSKVQIRRHVQQLVQNYLVQSLEATNKALRACVGPLSDDGLIVDLIWAYEILLNEDNNRVGKLNVAANRSLQDAPEEDKFSVDALVSLLGETAHRHLRVCNLLDNVRLQPRILLASLVEIPEWKHKLDRFKTALLEATHIEGLGDLRFLTNELQLSTRGCPERC